jgi:hypothetical protein
MHTEVDTLGTVMRDELLDTVLQLDANISEGKKGKYFPHQKLIHT